MLVSQSITAKLADFGESTHFDTQLAADNNNNNAAAADDDGDGGSQRRVLSGNVALTMTMVGTRIYCAPEILLGERCKCDGGSFNNRSSNTCY